MTIAKFLILKSILKGRMTVSITVFFLQMISRSKIKIDLYIW